MDFNELLKRKLKADSGIAYKFDRKTGSFYKPNQIILHFQPGTSLTDMKGWVDYFVKAATSRGVIIGVKNVTGFANGVCVVAADNPLALRDAVAIGVSGGGPHPPPPPPIIPNPFDVYRPCSVLVDGSLQFIVLLDSQRLTSLTNML